jgi:hypothetical protein
LERVEDEWDEAIETSASEKVSYPGGRTKQLSLSAEQKPLVQQWLRNYRKLKATLERICELNQHLLRPEKKA